MSSVSSSGTVPLNQELERSSNSVAEEGPKPSVLKHRLPALTASGHEDDPGLTAPTQTLEVPTEPPRRPVRPVSPGRNRPAAIHEDIDQEYQYIDFPEEAPTRSVLRHPLPALTTSRHEDNPSLAAPIETLEAPTEPSRLPVRPVSPGGKRPVAIHEDIDQEYAYFDLAEEAPNRSVPRHQLPALTSSRHEDNPGCTAPIEALDAPIEAPLEAPIEPPRRPGEPGKTSRKRQAAQFKDHNQDSKSLIKSTRSPVEYESATARDSQDQVSDSFEEYCTGNGQTLEQEPAFVLHRTVSAERISSRPGRSPRQAFHSRSPVHSQDSFALPSIPVAASEYNLPADHPIENTEVVELRRSNLPQRTSSLSEDTPRRASAGHSSEASSIPFAFDEAHILDDDPILEIINLHERQRSDSSSKPSSLSEENPRRESDSQSLAAPLNPFVSDEDQFSGDDKVLENIDLVSTRGSNALSTSSSLLVECSKTTLVSPAVTSTPVDSVENDFPGDHQILESFAPVRTRRASLPSILPSFLVEHSPTTLVSPAVTPTPVDSVENDFPGDHQILENFDLVRTRRARLTSRESIVREANSRRASGNPSHASSVYSQDPIEYHILENLDLVRTRRASLPSRESSFCAENSQRASNNLSHASSVYSQDPIEHQSVQSFDVVRTRRTSLPSRETISCVENTHRVSDNPSHASSVYSQDPIEHQNLQNFDLARTRRTSLPSRETIFCEENAHRVSDNPSHASSVYFQDPIETSHTSSQPLDTHSSSELVPAALVATQSSLEVNMENTRASVFLDPVTAQDNVMTSQKLAAIKIAKEQEQAIHEKLRRNGHDIPKYEFQELIGKGAYGRVFKSFDQEHNRVVALKVIDVDTTDYKVNARAKDDTIDDTVHEIKVLSQLKDSKAKNVNTMFDAFQVHSQLWIVNDYCPGGSVHTLVSLPTLC